MSKQFRAKTLEEAYKNATASLNCSITDLDIEIVQSGNKGFFGLFVKEAIILVELKNSHSKPQKQKEYKEPKPVQTKKPIITTTKSPETKQLKKVIQQPIEQPKEQIFDDFYSSADAKKTHDKITIKKDDNIITTEVQEKINKLFSHTCYKLDKIQVSFYDDETLYIEFKGEDAALLIGKEGYRYKALSYILFNWIHEKYNLMLRLEVAQFLTSQEEAISNYLVPVIQTIKEDGFYKTKPLDGVLVHIALKRLRDEFPEKYVAVKTNVKGDKYILVNEYRK